jgi:four helix bundle protein
MDYKELIVWQKSFELTKKIYQLTSKIHKEEQFGLISQMRRCSVSIPSNIAEGYGRFSKKYFLNFIKISMGSLLELETQVLLSKDLELVSETKEIEDYITEIKKMLSTLIKKHSYKS